MKYFLRFDRLKYFLLWVIAAFYLPQSIYGFWVYDLDYASKFLAITVIAVFFYVFFIEGVYTGNILRQFVNRNTRWAFDVKNLSCVVFGLYLALILYSSATADQVPLFMVFQGASIAELAKSREMFLRTREGWEAVIPYINAIFVMALLPYTIASLFYERHRLRFHFLGIFLFCLLLTLEKSVAVIALIPIIVLNINFGNNKSSKSVLTLILLVVIIGSVSFLARGGLQDGDAAVESDGASTIPENYRFFECDTQPCYIANRVFWIPYATAIDWLKYQDSVLDGNYVLGKSIGLIAALLDTPKINLEREVFSFQWGQNETGTGSANTVYFVDAFVNFSWIGVIFYTAVLALLIKIVDVSDNYPIKCTIFVSILYLGVNSLPPMLFSGGLLVIVFIALFFKQNKIKISDQQ